MGNILDTGGLILGLGSAAIGIASIFMPVAAPLLVGSVVAAGVSGTYSFGRSFSTLRDRHKHQQSISLMDSEARSAWIELILSAVAVGVSAGSVMSSVQAASTTGKAAASTTTAAGEAASSASSVAPQAAAKAGKGSRAAAARAAKVGKETKIVTAGSKTVVSGSKAGKAATNIGKKAAKAARASKLAKNAGHLSTGASKAAHEVANASKIATSAADISKKAAKILNSAKSASKVVDGAAKTPSFVKNTVGISNIAAKKSTGAAVKVTNETSKAALKTINTGKLTTRAAAKGLKTSKSVVNVSKGTKKLVTSSKIVSANVRTGESAAVITTAARNVSKLSKTMSDSKTSATNAPLYGIPTSTSNMTSSAAIVITFGYQILIEIAINENVSNVSLKHRELIEQILILYEKYVGNSIESEDITQIVSHINFYFNTIVRNPIGFLNAFICKLNETINYVYEIGHKNTKKSKEQVQICYSESSMEGEDIIKSMFAELLSAKIDWSLFDISSLEQQNLFADNFHTLNTNRGNVDTKCPSVHPSCNKWPDIETESVVSVIENEAGALQNVTGTEDDWETTSEEE